MSVKFLYINWNGVKLRGGRGGPGLSLEGGRGGGCECKASLYQLKRGQVERGGGPG